MNARTLITASFEDCGIIQAGEPLAAEQAQDGLRRLNNMCSTFRTIYGTVLSIDRNVFALTSNQQTYTIGLGGDFNVPRPLTIPAAALWLNGLSSPASVTSITRVGTVATVTQTAHPYAVGDEVFIAGANEPNYNGLQTVQTVPTANTYTYTVGFSTVTPATGTLTAAAVNGVPVEIPRPVITDVGFQSLQLKNMPNNQFTVVYYNPTQPYGELFLWPLPDVATNQLVLYLQNAFTGFADLTTDYEYPDNPGYAEALQYQLDRRLVTPYSVADPRIIAKIDELAAETFGNIKRANNKLVDLPSDAALFAHDPRTGYNINVGGTG